MGPGAMSERVGRNVRRFRAEQGMTQERLAELLTDGGMPLSDAAVSRLESGQRAITVDHLMALAEVLDRSPLELMEPAMERAPMPASQSRGALSPELLQLLAGLAIVTPETRATMARLTELGADGVDSSMERLIRPLMEAMARAPRPTDVNVRE
jgi:transcriptional regulator with XRE-family HTH domain